MAIHFSYPPTPTSSYHSSSGPLSLLTLFPSPPSTTHPQTFLYSPSPTEISFRVDSPVLPHYPSESTYRNSNSVIEINSPSHLHQTALLHSLSENSFHLPLSRWASSPTVIGGPSPLLTTYRVSDVRSGEMGLESDAEYEGEDYLAGWGVVPDHQPQSNADTEPLVTAPGLELPHIGEEDFLYYPETAELPFIDSAVKIDEKNEKGALRQMRRKLCKRTGPKNISLRGLVKRGLEKVKLRRFL